MIDIPFNPDFNEQFDRSSKNGEFLPCVVCGRMCKNPRYLTHVHGGFSVLVTEDEAKTMNEGADMGMFPIGSDCLKKHPELRPYVQEQPYIKPSEWQALYVDLYRQCFGENASDDDVMQDALRRLDIINH